MKKEFVVRVDGHTVELFFNETADEAIEYAKQFTDAKSVEVWEETYTTIWRNENDL